MRPFILLAGTAITLTFFARFFNNKTTHLTPVAAKPNYKSKVAAGDNAELLRLKKYSSALSTYAAAHQYNTNYCFLVDVKLPPGSNRFFVYDLKKDSIIKAGLVANGYGGGSGNSIHFSNVSGSNCTSLGKYKIGNAYYGRFGLAYKLYGLDPTNSNAFKRFVVLHAHECVPGSEVSPAGICMSQGCPTVSPVFLSSLKEYLGKTQSPMLLYIFY